MSENVDRVGVCLNIIQVIFGLFGRYFQFQTLDTSPLKFNELGN